eukprot:maker-scaffold_33-snap-gene-0.2-mRNA-1 protein AED:0.01 eAED:0.01 QI:94/1/1/1/1/1/3/309/431
MTNTSKSDKLKGALYGFVVSDSYNFPFHWYYDTKKLMEAFPDIDNMGLSKAPAIHTAGGIKKLPYIGETDIYFDHKDIFSEGFMEEGVHYHKTLEKGQNTHNMCIARLLMRQLNENYGKVGDKYSFYEVYSPKEHAENFFNYTTTNPKDHPDDKGQVHASNDLYYDRYLREYFRQFDELHLPYHKSAFDERFIWDVNAIDGLNIYLPLIFAHINEPAPYLIARGIEIQQMTHKSLSVSAGYVLWVPFLQKIIHHKHSPDDDLNWFYELLDKLMSRTRAAKITPGQMFKTYANTPEKIPKDEKWQQHLEFREETMKEYVEAIIEESSQTDFNDNELLWKHLGPACYMEMATVTICFLLKKYVHLGFKKTLLANAKLGGHTTGRGVLLGAILGSLYGVGGDKGVPQDWIDDLADPTQIEKEVQGVVEIGLNRH